MDEKPRIRVPVSVQRTTDGFNNFTAALGLNADNIFGRGGYLYSNLTRNRFELDAMYRTSPMVGMAVDIIADDMTQAGISFKSEMDPKQSEKLYEALDDMEVWGQMNLAIKWSRLYGSAIIVFLIDGQDLETPFRPETVRPGQFKGLCVLDRWQLIPDLTNLVQDYGPNFGMPEFYTTVFDSLTPDLGRVHHSRCIRLDGIKLPHSQRMTENMWAESVIERIQDRLVAFDSTSVGVAQLVFKAYLRTWKVQGLRQMLGGTPQLERNLIANVQWIRRTQTNEGLTMIDQEDDIESTQYNFAGLDEVLLQIAMQISGAIEIPLVRLLGQSPGGLGSNGESERIAYYDGIGKKQGTQLKNPMKRILQVLSLSINGRPLPDGFRFEFNSLWKMNDKEKADVAKTDADTIGGAYDRGLISAQTALREFRNSSHATGRFSNISDEDINSADDEPPKMDEVEPKEDDDKGGVAG